jgi:hypothetical protein
MSTTKPNPLFSRSEKSRFKRTVRKRVHGAARKGFSKLFGIPLSQGLSSGKTTSGKTTSRQPAHRSSRPASGPKPSTAVRSDVISALRGQGYSAGMAKKMAEGVRDGDDFESAFRRVISKNPAELVIFGNPSQAYTRKGVIRAKRAGNPIPAALVSAFESAAGSKLFDEVTSGKKRNSHRGGAETRRNGKKKEFMPDVKRLVDQADDLALANEIKMWLKTDVEGPRMKKLTMEEFEAALKRLRKRRFLNPDPIVAPTKLFEKFHHREAEGVFERQRSARVRKDYTILGPLVAIGINAEKFDAIAANAKKNLGKKGWEDWAVEHYDELPRLDFMTPSQVATVKSILGDPAKYVENAPLLAGSPNGRTLYALAEDVQMDLSKFDTDTQKDLVDLGEATFVVYIAKKPHEVREWVHIMGEDGGTRPRLMYDKLRKEVCFIGGSYVVKGPGIMH